MEIPHVSPFLLDQITIFSYSSQTWSVEKLVAGDSDSCSACDLVLESRCYYAS